MPIPFSDVSLIAVVVATIVNMAIGFAWYSPGVFGTMWMKLAKINESDMKKANMQMSIGTGFVATLLTAYFLSVILSIVGTVSMSEAVTVAILVWLAGVVPLELHGVAWQSHPFKLFVLNAAHYFVSFVVAASVLQWWPW